MFELINGEFYIKVRNFRREAKCDEMCISASAGGSTAWRTSGRSERNITERFDERSLHHHCSRLQLKINC